MNQNRLKDSFYKQIMSQILPSHIVNFPNDIKIHEGARQYYTDIGIISYIDNYNCANYAGTVKCNKENSKTLHRGHGSIAAPLKSDS